MKISIPHPNDNEAITNIVIDDYDTWNADWTLSLVIHPVLLKLKEEEFGFPSCFNNWKEWSSVLDTMIYSFEQAKSFYSNLNKLEKKKQIDEEISKLELGFNNFGKYYMNLWT